MNSVNKKLFILLFSLVMFSSLAFAAYSSSYMNNPPNYQSYYSSSAGDGVGSRLSTYWSILDDSDQCRARQDVILQIAPAGCSPSVVRSDLLAEQNVAVFCQVNALQINPAIEIERINNIRFSGSKYPEGVVGAGFHPVRAALRTRDSLMGDPISNNIGYVVVILKKNSNESSLPDYVNMTLNGILQYDSGNAFGLGKYEFILDEQTDAEWEFEKNKQSFFRGNYFLRLERAEPEYSLVSVYQGDKKLYTVRLEKGKTSNDIYLPGFYCQAALNFEYSSYEAAQKSARIEVSDSKGTETFDVYERSTFMDGKCSVREIKVNGKGESGNVTIVCDNNNRVLLQMKPRGAEFAVGDLVNYYSDLTKTDSKSAKQVRIINISTDNIYSILSDDGSISKDVLSIYLKAITQKNTGTKYRDKQYSNETDDAFKSAIAEYERVADEYPAEKNSLGDNLTYAEQALVSAKDLAKDFGKTQTRYRLLNRLIEEYPNSVNINEYNSELSYLSVYDSSYSETVVVLNNDYKTLRLVGLSLPKKASSLTFSLNARTDSAGAGKSFGDTTIEIGQDNLVNGLSGVSAQLDKIESDRATILFKCAKSGSSSITRSVTISTNKYEPQNIRICDNDYVIVYRDSNIERVARVKIYPKAKDTRTETNLSVAIGIEKRAIKLNPEKTLERIDIINDSIKRWEGISNSLGKAVSGLKAACFATSAALTVKNFVTGLDGTALARQKVMQDMGWSERCRIAYQDKKPIEGTGHSPYSSIDDCFSKNEKTINAQIEAVKNAISSDNSNIENIISDPDNSRTGGLFSGKQAIYENVAVDYINGKQEVLKNRLGFEITGNDYKNGSISYEQAQKIVLYDSLINSGTLDSASEKQINDELGKIKETVNTNKQRNLILSQAISSSSALQNEFVNVYSDQRISQKGYWTGRTANQLGLFSAEGMLKDNDKIALSIVDGKTYAFKLSDQPSSSGSDYYPTIDVFELNGNSVTSISEGTFKTNLIRSFPQFEKVSEATYRNVYEGAEIRYFETDPYKGVPEVTPIDTREGWYAGIRNDLPLLSAQANVDASGAVASFWLCNVGKNKREEFRKDGFGDDVCKRFDFYTGQALDEFPGISDRNKVKRLVSTAVNSIREAQQQYKSGITGKSVKINGEQIKVGNPAIKVTGSNCQDFMSASDCKILFNVCDPVICPNSRCNLGGQFYVQDVVQSGIVGSTLLCLPNIREGIYVPVCLSGLKAGIDGLVSVMKSHRDCLQKNVETGEMVGICDQLYSVYLCDFFWKQIAPAVNVLLPKLIEFAYTGGKNGVRGGGEYMTVMFAWENAQKSVDYFTQSYAANSFKAFNLKSAQDIGDQFCKSFVSTKVPTNIKSLLEGDSPVQFYAYFDSSTLSTATLPATAQYKVYYHIFAGNDFGAYYSVYLKDAPQTSFYVANPTIQVASGFLPKGESADEARDFSAPEGYKQLCVRINDEEKCGFKQVTTDFGINYLSNKVVANEITEREIKTENECISGAGLANGDISATSLLNPNIQSALESATNPKVYERGIIRVCSTENPASATNPSRYVQVGYCDSSQKVKCWLDKKSVDNALVEGDVGTRNATLSELSEINEEYLGEKLVNTDQIKSQIKSIEESVKSLILNQISKGQGNYNMQLVKGNLTLIDNILLNGDESGVILNSEKARLIKLKGEIREAVARNYLKYVAQTNINTAIKAATSSTSTNPTSTQDPILNKLIDGIYDPGQTAEIDISLTFAQIRDMKVSEYIGRAGDFEFYGVSYSENGRIISGMLRVNRVTLGNEISFAEDITSVDQIASAVSDDEFRNIEISDSRNFVFFDLRDDLITSDLEEVFSNLNARLEAARRGKDPNVVDNTGSLDIYNPGKKSIYDIEFTITQIANMEVSKFISREGNFDFYAVSYVDGSKQILGVLRIDRVDLNNEVAFAEGDITQDELGSAILNDEFQDISLDNTGYLFNDNLVTKDLALNFKTLNAKLNAVKAGVDPNSVSSSNILNVYDPSETWWSNDIALSARQIANIQVIEYYGSVDGYEFYKTSYLNSDGETISSMLRVNRGDEGNNIALAEYDSFIGEININSIAQYVNEEKFRYVEIDGSGSWGSLGIDDTLETGDLTKTFTELNKRLNEAKNKLGVQTSSDASVSLTIQGLKLKNINMDVNSGLISINSKNIGTISGSGVIRITDFSSCEVNGIEDICSQIDGKVLDKNTGNINSI